MAGYQVRFLRNLKIELFSANLTGLYKLRVGDYRVIYEILWEEKSIIILKISMLKLPNSRHGPIRFCKT
jgi:mRNA-degrading endonuclease RelE of RelBE toxin-antitoxin system